jgi:hypothetical protein
VANSLTEVIDANNESAVSNALTLSSTETTVTLSVFHDSGSQDNYRTVIQQSPRDTGGKWREVGGIINGIGSTTVVIAAERVRAKMHTAEGSASSVEIFIVAK